MEADLEDGAEILEAGDKSDFYQRYKRLRPLQLTTAYNSIKAYAEDAYKVDAGLLQPIPVDLPHPDDRLHIDRANKWFDQEIPPKAPGRRHRILVIEGETGTGKTAFARSKGTLNDY